MISCKVEWSTGQVKYKAKAYWVDLWG